MSAFIVRMARDVLVASAKRYSRQSWLARIELIGGRPATRRAKAMPTISAITITGSFQVTARTASIQQQYAVPLFQIWQVRLNLRDTVRNRPNSGHTCLKTIASGMTGLKAEQT